MHYSKSYKSKEFQVKQAYVAYKSRLNIIAEDYLLMLSYIL